ncbi:hypothetical protein KBY28_07765 [Ruegeria pomeroyi]|uniref:hypothetical protein n=1 Tax=Ruegeria pomeroyi TaxID=89184 RepID=UPI001F1DD67A|nr:hypothetical protein [Ruegeria pomeroyi]MCE8508346.1 hypothetical protein [Ruegeria pomeroyi]
MSSSKSASSTATSNKDGRVAVDNGGVGVSAEGDVTIHMVPDEAFELGEAALFEMADLARGSMEIGVQQTEAVQDTLSKALFETQRAAKTEAAQVSEMIVKMGIPALALVFIAGKVFK